MTICKEDWAYLAGLMDGEGCIQTHHSGSNIIRPQITITQADDLFLVYMQHVYGLGKIQHIGKNNRRYTRWFIYPLEEVKLVLNSTLPYLKLKKTQAEVCLRLCSIPSKKRRVGHPLDLQLRALKVPTRWDM